MAHNQQSQSDLDTEPGHQLLSEKDSTNAEYMVLRPTGLVEQGSASTTEAKPCQLLTQCQTPLSIPRSLRCCTPELQDSGIALINPEYMTSRCCSALAPIPPQTFPAFPLLPAEIRLRIYELALPAQGTTVSRIYNTEELRFGLRRRVPPVLQACRESRYSLVRVDSATDMRRMPFELVCLPSTGKGVYVDWEKDSLLIRRGCEFFCSIPIRNFFAFFGISGTWIHN